MPLNSAAVPSLPTLTLGLLRLAAVGFKRSRKALRRISLDRKTIETRHMASDAKASDRLSAHGSVPVFRIVITNFGEVS